VLVAGGVDRRGIDRSRCRVDARRSDLAADGGGLVLGGAGLEQRSADLGDGRRLGDEPGGEVAPASDGAQLVDLGDVGATRRATEPVPVPRSRTCCPGLSSARPIRCSTTGTKRLSTSRM
jgi:hypothetical protein